MEPYFEFYSDLDLLIQDVEALWWKCHKWWMDNVPFSEKEPNDSKWLELEDKLIEIQDMLQDEPFFKNED